MVKIDLDEKKHKLLLRRKAKEITLEQYYNDTISYKDMKKELDEEAPLVIGKIIICCAITVSYICVLVIFNLYFASSNNLFTMENFNLFIGVAIGIFFGLLIGYTFLHNYPQMKVEENYKNDYTKTILEMNEKN
jgi:hypothetical protein